MNQSIRIEQKQLLSTHLLQSLNILAMNNSELSEFISDEYSNNPLLDITESNERSDNLLSVSSWLKTKISPDSRPINIIDEDRNDFDIPDVSDYSLKEYLKLQLYHKNFSDYEWKLIDSILDLIDDSGFMTTPIKDISLMTSAPIYDIVKYISILQNLEPAGVCAADLCDCLILQLKRKGIYDNVYEKLLKYYLNDIALGHLNKISKELNIPKQQIQIYVQNIKSLDPKPCKTFGNCTNQYIVPDIIFHNDNGNWEISINDYWGRNIGISNLYLKYYKGLANSEVSSYFEEKIKRAKFLITCIEQRHTTLLKLSNYLLEHQFDFIAKQGPIKPMMPSKVAKDLGVHPSTISRAIKDKYIQIPSGNYTFKFFFDKECQTTNESHKKNENVSRKATKEMIRKLTTTSNSEKPLSDSKIASILLESGIKISRRTVSKYREEMGISNTYERKCV